jgi:hypothetical protein
MPENFDALSEGVDPGGLYSKNDIRIMICYILNSIGQSIDKNYIINTLQTNNMANFFELNDAMFSLINSGCINENPSGLLTLTEKGKEIADTLDVTLPLSVRNKAVSSAMSFLAAVKTSSENNVEINKTENGFNVVCHISDGINDLLEISLYVPDKLQAEMVKDNFHKDPEHIYKIILSNLTEYGSNKIH